MAARFLTSLLAFVTAVSAIPTITTTGSKFFTSNGNQWFIKGVAYQLLPADPLVDTAQCQLDAALMQTLGANAIRVYHVDPSLNHDGCMQAFADVGIYAFVDLDTFSSQIDESAPVWTPAQLGAFEYVMDAFQGYDNLAGFFIGNEVINSVGVETAAAPYVKASVTDLKAYRNAMGYREIPIGYSHADVAGLRPILQDYLACGDASTSIDFFGLNAYEWCGDATYMSSGYEILYEQTVNYTVPIFFSETGCNQPEPRSFADQNAIFTNMSNVWSGAIIYEWIQEENHYGIITYNSDDTNALDYDAPAGGYSRSGTPTPVTPDFNNVMTQWATLNPTGISAAAYTPTLTSMACPASTAGTWEVDPSAALPTLGLNVAIPTSSALSEANYGLSSYTTPVRGHAVAVTSVALSSPVVSANSLASAATSTSIAASASSSISAAASSANSLRSSQQSSAISVASTASAGGAAAVVASTSGSSASASSAAASNAASNSASHSTTTTATATTTAAAASATKTGAAVRSIQTVGMSLFGLLVGVVIFL